MTAHFPVLLNRDERLAFPACPGAVPWALLAPNETRARLNHGQTLRRLAERGGLCPSEMVAVIEDRAWAHMDLGEAVVRLEALLASWQAQQTPGAA